MTTALVDYDSGNLHSAQKAFERMAAEVGAGPIIVTSDPDVVARADRIVLPGDGAFPHCRAELFARTGLAEAIAEAVTARARPFFGICVGMQMMATTGHEYEPTAGFDWVAGDICKINPSDSALKVPHMGWNTVESLGETPLLAGVEGQHFYFVHGYAVKSSECSTATTEYGGRFVSVASRDNFFATQFHPERSGAAGARLIANFLGMNQ